LKNLIYKKCWGGLTKMLSVSPQLKGDKLCGWLGRIRTYEALLKAECLPHPPFCYQPKFADYGTNQKVGGIGFAPMQT